MSLFGSPEEHAANPPETWEVRRHNTRWWGIYTKGGDVLEWCERKRDAVEALTTGPSATLYRRESDWYAGKTPPGWVDYDPAKHSRKGA